MQQISYMLSISKKHILIIVVFLLLAWSPWITDDYAISKVTEKIGGPNTEFFYLDKKMLVKEIPKQVIWLPFSKQVIFPGEAAWIVTFYVDVI